MRRSRKRESQVILLAAPARIEVFLNDTPTRSALRCASSAPFAQLIVFSDCILPSRLSSAMMSVKS
jgi:hypothetical protein